MKDIAAALGVSVATVSRALKDSRASAKHSGTKIKGYAREHNIFLMCGPKVWQQQDQAPEDHRRDCATVATFYFPSVLSGIELEAASRGYSILVGQSAGNITLSSSSVSASMSTRCAG